MRFKIISPELLDQILSPEFQERFWVKVGIKGPDECWLWNASKVEFGYGQMGIRLGGLQFHFGSHQLAWIIHNRARIPDGLCILHSCVATPGCCNPNHLRAGTQLENIQEMTSQGRRTNRKGVNSPLAKLTEAQVLQIRKLHSLGNFTHDNLAAMFGIGHTRIWEIVTGKAWTHI